ncbi:MULTISPECIES: sensor histidine kinase [Campylobacter]|uniref:sensor histidine kinase n=1 Tax=Campylobacter TaxID=194 RepID=UPI00147083AC|nr:MULTISPECIES: HAMP domain-containing sensor histidine kinase [Campylobacter]MBN7287715.1 HAMP domain-containing histidine kinase [Campylobacter curvus]MDU6826417.1 HAMP domain-containing sensor histidine kinase [Campylobacter sp.]
MLNKRHVLPIFLLYFLTSITFTVLFAGIFYQNEKMFIIDKDTFELRDLRRELQMKLDKHGELDDDDFDDFEAYVVDLKTGDVIEDDFDVRSNMPSSYEDGNSLVVQFNIADKNAQNEYYIAIKTTGVKTKLFRLKLKILFASLGVLAAVLLIAYFIIRLSLRPLYEKIEFLDGFIRDTTHEINTPLSVILMSIELFKSDPAKYLSNIKTAATTIANLYEDLVALRLKNGTKDEKERLDLTRMLSERIEYFSTSIEQKNINLKLDLANDVSLFTSKFKLRKIIDNLLSNAVKYCNEGGNISVNLTPGELNIKNSGKGIAKQNLPHIFELYTRFDEQNGGFGIGLNIVKKFCDELNFKITCQSNERLTSFEVKFSKA